MKQNSTELTAMLLGASLLLLDLAASAQTANRAAWRPSVAGKRPHAAIEPLQVMKQSLSLSDEQAQKLDPVLKEPRDKLNALRRDTSLSRKDRIAKLKEIQHRTDAKMKALLTPEQADKWQKLRHGQGPVFRQQAQNAGKTNAFSIGPQVGSARQGLPAWSTHTQPRQPGWQRGGCPCQRKALCPGQDPAAIARGRPQVHSADAISHYEPWLPADPDELIRNGQGATRQMNPRPAIRGTLLAARCCRANLLDMLSANQLPYKEKMSYEHKPL